jgi:hypothetical protein
MKLRKQRNWNKKRHQRPKRKNRMLQNGLRLPRKLKHKN